MDSVEVSVRRNGASAGQATVEYVLLLFLIFVIFTAVSRFIADKGIMQDIAAPLQKNYKTLYQYGHPKAKGQDGGYEFHPEGLKGKPIRVFINTR